MLLPWRIKRFELGLTTTMVVVPTQKGEARLGFKIEKTAKKREIDKDRQR